LQLKEGPVEVLSDPDMLGLALIQLLDNAFRYSPPAAIITVTVRFEEHSALVRVSNQGPPILPEEQKRIFDRFYRGSAGHQVSGTGLGLYVARKIVVAHGGSLELDAGHKYGSDTTFCLRLPIAKEMSQSMKSKPVRVLVVDNDAAMRRTLRASLAVQEYLVFEARSGEEALEEIVRHPADLVLLDIEMPGIGGLETCRRLRNMAPQAGVVMVTVCD
jgi:hypothetical protein